MNEIARELKGPADIDASFDERVMAAVRQMPRHGRFGLWARLTTPRARTFTLTPLTYGLLAASIAAFAVLGAAHASVDLRRVAQPIMTAILPAKPAASAQRVQF